MKRSLLEAWVEARRARRPSVLLTWLESGEQRLVFEPGELESELEADEEALRRAVVEALSSDRAHHIALGAQNVFVQPDNPAVRLVIVGAVHIAQHLAAWAARLGYEVTVVDPRAAFASRERFPEATLCHDWPDAALDAIGLDRRSAVVVLSHDPKLDDPALERVLRSESFYVGALGSRRTQAKRRERLREMGLDEATIERVRGPVGLDLGARSAAEIALSIAAELVACLRGRDGRDGSNGSGASGERDGGVGRDGRGARRRERGSSVR